MIPQTSLEIHRIECGLELNLRCPDAYDLDCVLIPPLMSSCREIVARCIEHVDLSLRRLSGPSATFWFCVLGESMLDQKWRMQAAGPWTRAQWSCELLRFQKPAWWHNDGKSLSGFQRDGKGQIWAPGWIAYIIIIYSCLVSCVMFGPDQLLRSIVLLVVSITDWCEHGRRLRTWIETDQNCLNIWSANEMMLN